jgi:PAS domain S-box-containing protein
MHHIKKHTAHVEKSRQAILIVDDMPENIDVLAGILDDEYTVRAALDGETALKIASENPAPDIILLDVMMPGMDGYEVCRKLKSSESTKKIPVIFVTAMGEVSDESAGFEAGGVDYVIKPVSPPVVLARVKTHLALYDQSRYLEEMVREQTVTLSELNAFFISVMECSSGSIAVVDRNGKFTYVNPQTRTMSGRDERELMDCHVADLFDPGDAEAIREHLLNVVSNRITLKHIEARLVRPDGGRALIEMSMSPRLMAGAAIGAVITADDVTEKRAMEAQLIHASKMASIGEMATGMAHELNQPLSIINMAAQLVKRGISEGDYTEEFISDRMNIILKQVGRASGIINHLRTFGRKDDANFTEMDINVPIREAFSMIDEQLKNRGIKANLKLENGLPPILGDSSRLEQVFVNLIVNARDALEVVERPDQAKHITVSSFHDAASGTVHVLFSDNGVGIPANMIARVFDPFFTTKEIGKGTGLGLSISYGIIRSHGGTMRVDSSEEGATFTIQLPVKK